MRVAGLFVHERRLWAEGEHCSMCGAPAMHKVEEEGARPQRHPFTAYVCCACFARIMGPVAADWCGVE